LSIVTTFSIIKLSQKLVKNGIPGNFIYQLKKFLQELALLNIPKTGCVHVHCIEEKLKLLNLVKYSFQHDNVRLSEIAKNLYFSICTVKNSI